MGFVIDYDELTALGFGIQSKLGQWSEGLSAVQGSLNSFVGLESFRGEAADGVKAYVSEVHGVALAGLTELLSELGSRFLLYKDGYYTEIDSDPHARLDEDVLDDLARFFTGSRDEFEDTHQRLRQAIGDVSDVVGVDAPSSFSVGEGYDTVLSDVARLKNNVRERESACVADDFTVFDRLAEALAQFLDGFQGVDMAGVSGYVPESVRTASGFEELLGAWSDAVTGREVLTGVLSDAVNREQERLDVLKAEWAQEREEQGWLTVLGGAVVVVGGAAAILLTAGLATPVVVAVAVTGSAAMAYGASNMVEGIGDISYGSHGDYSTVAVNPLRDTVFEWAFGEDGKQQAWDTFGAAAILVSSVLTLGAGGAAHGLAKVGDVCVKAKIGAGVKGAGEGLLKGVISTGAGVGTGYLGEQVALSAGASESVAQMIGLGTGLVGGGAVGVKVNKWKWNYQPGESRLIPDGVCFVAGTLVATPTGLVRIEDIRVGDLVIATNPDTGDTADRLVTQTYVRETDTLIHLQTGGEAIQVTPEHPFHVAEMGWVKAKDLKPGDRLDTVDGTLLTVDATRVEVLPGLVTVYNMEVDDYHTYHVGSSGILVHNAGYGTVKPLSKQPVPVKPHPEYELRKDGFTYSTRTGARSATQAEADGLQQARASLWPKRTSLKRNVAYTEGEVDGASVSGIAHSGRYSGPGSVGMPEKPQLPTHRVRGSENAHEFDSEIKLFESLLSKTTPASSGRITLVTERDMCASCVDAMSVFTGLRPNIVVEVVFKVTYP